MSAPHKMLSINSKGLVVYDYYGKRKEKTNVCQKSKDNLQKAYKSPSLSHGSAKKIKKILTHWILAVNMSQKLQRNTYKKRRRYLVMVTLTLPSKQVEPDKEFKRKYLNNFLIQLKKETDITSYLWVAEKQKNGNIHFHIIVDSFCKQNQVQRIWNRVLSNGKYIEEFRNKFNHSNPPTTHLRGQKQMTNPADYLTKYVTKAEKSKPIEGVKWACSSNLLELITLKVSCKFWYHKFLECYRKDLKVKYVGNSYVDAYLFEGDFLQEFVDSDIFLDNEYNIATHYSKIFPELLINPPQKVQENESFANAQLRFEMS